MDETAVAVKPTAIKIAAVCGSLRRGSLNRGLILSAIKLCDEAISGMLIEFVDISGLPLLNTDLEIDGGLPSAVEDFRRKILHADSILFASPEYNYSISAPLKNAIDWASRPPNVWAGKSAAIISAAGGSAGQRSQYHLRQELQWIHHKHAANNQMIHPLFRIVLLLPCIFLSQKEHTSVIISSFLLMASSKEEAAGVRPSAAAINLFWFDLPLRSLLFASTVAAVVVMATGKQTKEVTIPGLAPLVLVAKFSYSPSFIYFVVATSVAALYSLVTAIFVWRTNWTARILLYQSFCDAVILGVVASATGAAASIAYVGHNGNSHVGWLKICDMFDEFCRHVGASLVLSAFSSFLLILLVLLSTYSALP